MVQVSDKCRGEMGVAGCMGKDAGYDVTAWGGGIEPIARGGQIGQKDGRGGADKRRQSPADGRRPGSQVAERSADKECKICRVERGEM